MDLGRVFMSGDLAGGTIAHHFAGGATSGPREAGEGPHHKGGQERHKTHFILAVVDHATRAFPVMATVGEGEEHQREKGGGAPTREEEEHQRERRRRSAKGEKEKHRR